MLLRALRYTGRGFMFDTDVSVETQLVFYHTFIEWESIIIFVHTLKCSDDAIRNHKNYASADFTRAIGSTDAEKYLH